MIIFVLIDVLPGLIDLHCVVQVPELMHKINYRYINLPFLWNTNIVNSSSYGAFKSKLKFFYLNLVLGFCAVVAVVVILCVVYHNYCFFLVSLFFFFLVLVASCTLGSIYYRPSPLVQPFLSKIKISIQFNSIIMKQV